MIDISSYNVITKLDLECLRVIYDHGKLINGGIVASVFIPVSSDAEGEAVMEDLEWFGFVRNGKYLGKRRASCVITEKCVKYFEEKALAG